MNYKFIFSFFCLWLSSVIFSQAPAIEWQRTYGGTSADTHADVQQTADGGYIHIGTSISNNGDVTGNHGNGDIWVVKTNPTGDILWQKCLGGTSLDQGSSIRQTTDGGYILAGTSSSTNGDVTGNNGNKDYWVVKLNATGNIQWQKNYGGNNDDIATSIRPTSEGGYIVTGYKSMAPPTMVGGDRKYWVVKLDSSGNLQWQNTYGGENWEEANCIEQTTDGGYIIAGYSSSLYTYVIGNHGGEDYWIIKINATGALEWQKSLGGSSSENARAIKQAQDGGYFVVGYSYSNNGDVTGNNGTRDYWVVKLNAIGSIVWQKSFGTSLWEDAVGVDTTLDGGCVVTGYGYVPKDGSPNNIDYWVLKLNSSGNIEWQNYYGGLLTDQASSIQKTSDGGYILGGFSYAGSNGSTDYWIIKLAGNQLNTHENNSKSNISIYPNPAKDFVTIDHLPSETTISIFDLSGRKIFSKKYTESKVSMNTSQLTNGTYIIQVDDHEKIILSEKLMIKK